jgi:hypothetical protein
MCSLLTFLSHTDITSFFFHPISFGGLRQENYVGMWGHYGSKIIGIFSKPLSKVSSSTTDILWGIGLLAMEDCAPFIFLKSWALVVLNLCFRFRIFYKLILKAYVFHVEGGPHLL